MHNHMCGGEKKSCQGMMFCQEHGNYKHLLIRMIVLFGVLAVVFWLGTKVGEFRGEYRNYNGGNSSNYMPGYRMMFDNNDNAYYYGRMGLQKSYTNTQGCAGQMEDLNAGTRTGQGYQNGMMRINVTQ